ncbi:MAG: transposase [Desulfobulbaceae bacterium]|nr:transposase [Desulfobulbaceae bacterium]
MKRKRFSEEQIIRILKEGEAIGNIREVCRLHNLTEQTFYRWRNKYCGMEVSDAKKLKGLEK